MIWRFRKPPNGETSWNCDWIAWLDMLHWRFVDGAWGTNWDLQYCPCASTYFMCIKQHMLKISSSDPHPETLKHSSDYSDKVSDIPSGSIYGIFVYSILFWHSIWHFFWHKLWYSIWHSVWHLFWHSFWHSIRHLFWHSTQHLFRHSFWHSFWHLFRLPFWHSNLTLSMVSEVRQCTLRSGARSCVPRLPEEKELEGRRKKKL